MMTDIQPQYITFDDLLTRRLFRIPQYQRANSWGAKQRQDLFGDIDRTWERRPAGFHFLSTIVGLARSKVRIITEDYQMIEIVDGQQRLTTLIILLKAISAKLDRSDEIGQMIGSELDKTLVKPDKATLLLLETNHDSSNYFADYIRKGYHPKPTSAQTLADRELLAAIEDCENYVSPWHTKGKLADLIALLKNQLTCIFHQIGDEALVYSVFEVLNSRGLDVSWFDRLKSMLMGIVYETGAGTKSEIIDEVHRLWTDIYRRVGLRIGMSEEALQFAATLRVRRSLPNRPLGQAEAADLLRRQSSTGPSQVIETTSWLKAVTESVDRLRADRRKNAVTSILQARMVAAAVLLRSDLSESDREAILRRWESITFRIYGLFDRDARTAVGDYVRLAWRIVNGKLSATQILESLSLIGAQFPIEKASELLTGSDRYNGWQEELRYFFYRYEEHLARQAGQNFDNEQWNRIWEASAADSIEHIFPQSSGDDSWVHRLGNLVILPPGLNSKLGAKPPKNKADAYSKTGLLLTQELVGNLPNWGRPAIEDRERSLLEWAAKEWAE